MWIALPPGVLNRINRRLAVHDATLPIGNMDHTVVPCCAELRQLRIAELRFGKGANHCGSFRTPRDLGLATATTSPAFFPHLEQRTLMHD